MRYFFAFALLFFVLKYSFAFENTSNSGLGKQDRIDLTENRLIDLKKQVNKQKQQINDLNQKILLLETEINKVKKVQNAKNSSASSTR